MVVVLGLLEIGVHLIEPITQRQNHFGVDVECQVQIDGTTAPGFRVDVDLP